jgi:uncharacterized protein YrrD
MQFKGVADVLTASNETVGKVERVVLDPRTKEVTHLVVRKGLLFKRDKVLPVTLVGATGEDDVRLRPDAGDPSELPDFEETHYVMAEMGTPTRPPDEAPPAGRPPVATASLVVAGVAAPSLLWYPPAIGYNGYAAGPGPFAGPAVPGAVKTVDRNIPDNTVPLREGAKVVASDGERVGHVERVFVNSETKQATHWLLHHGTLTPTHKAIPMQGVEAVTEREVRLAVNSKLVNGLPEYKN